MKPVRLVCATPHTQEAFKRCLLGVSLGRLDNQILCDVVYNNRAGLGEVYNRFITDEHKHEILVFLHDDIFIDDYWIDVRLNDAIKDYDVIGLTGVSYRTPVQGWDGVSPWDCGTIIQGRPETGKPWRSRDRAPHKVFALDGQCIAINTQRVMDAGIRWDEQFTFDFYDIDFCHQCVEKGLSVGVWPLALTHAGLGKPGLPRWVSLLEAFKRKWK